MRWNAAETESFLWALITTIAVVVGLMCCGCASDRVSKYRVTYQPESHSVTVELELTRD